MSMWDPLSSAAYGATPIGSAYPTMSPIKTVGAMGRPGPAFMSGENPMTAFAVVLGLTLLGLFAASYSGKVKLGPFQVAGSVGAGK